MIHIRSLDGLRGLAAYLVVLAHFSGQNGHWDHIFGGGVGQIGVMIFFALSGFLMAYLCFETPIHPVAIGKFYWRRLARVYPLFAVLVILFFLFNQFVIGGRGFVFDIDLPVLVQHLTLQSGQGPLWTIPVEIWFYVCVPLFWMTFRKAGFIGLGVLILALLAVQYAIGFKSYFMPLNRASLTGTGHFFLFGFLMWMLYRQSDRLESRHGGIQHVYNAGFVVLMLLLVPLFPNVLEVWSGEKTPLWRFSLYFAYIPALLFFTAKSSWAAAILGSAVPAYLGKISYSVYLWHLPCLAVLALLLGGAVSPYLQLALALLSTTLVASLSYFIVEMPSRTFLNRLIRSPGKTKSG